MHRWRELRLRRTLVVLEYIIPIGLVLLLNTKPKKKKKKSSSCDDGMIFNPDTGECEAPYEDDSCGDWPWLGVEVDEVSAEVIDSDLDYVSADELDVDSITLQVADEVYPIRPGGEPMLWPPEDDDDEDAWCILERISGRVEFLIDKIEDDDGDGIDGLTNPPDDEDDDDDEDGSLDDLAPPKDDGLLPLPEPGPVDVESLENPDNYPQMERFHQVYYRGGDKSYYDKGHPGYHSAQSVKYLAQKAIMDAVYRETQDLELARAIADDESVWREYRNILTESPFHQALYAVEHSAGAYYYGSPSGTQISLMPYHDDVRGALEDGRSPMRTIVSENGHNGNGGDLPYVWMVPLDMDALIDHRQVRVDPETWETGDTKLVPPPEVLALEII